MNWVWLACANAPISERTRLGLAIEKAGCAVSARTRSSVAGSGDRGLQREPLVDDQRIVARSACRNRRARPCAPARSCSDSVVERRHAVGHVVGVVILLRAPARSRRASPVAASRSRQTFLQRAPAGARGVRAVGAGVGQARDRSSRSAAPSCAPIARAQRRARARRSRRDRRRGRSRGRCRPRSAGVSACATKAGSSVVVGEDRRRARRSGRRPSRGGCAGAQRRDVADQQRASPASAPPASG